MPYTELLQQQEWHDRCAQILHRDGCRCKKCGAFGFHQDAVMECDNLSQVDELLTGWEFKGMKFSDYAKTIPFTPLDNKRQINVENKGQKHGVNIYSIPCTAFDNPFELGSVPLKFLSDKDFKTIHLVASYQTAHHASKLSDPQKYPWIFYFETEEYLTDKIYVRIDQMLDSAYFDDGICPGNIIYTTQFLNVTFGNKIFILNITDENNPVKGLNVHHRYYVKDKLPWEYPDEALVTLCEDCHKKLHESCHVPIYSSENDITNPLGYAVTCDRCGGSGYLPQYNHVQHGICFKCGGEGVVIE